MKRVCPGRGKVATLPCASPVLSLAFPAAIWQIRLHRHHDSGEERGGEMTKEIAGTKATRALLRDIRTLIQEARSRVAVQVNNETTLLYWNIGKRINGDVLDGKRADYGEQIVSTVSTQLQQEFGRRGFDQKSIRRMMQFASLFPDPAIVATLSRQLSWSHFVEVIPLADDVQREFYLTMAMHEGWGIRALREKIDGMLYERSLISGKSEGIIRSALSEMRTGGTISPDVVFKSPYFLDFTGLRGVYSESSLEDRLILHLEQFIMELGAGFSFVARQKRMKLDKVGIRVAQYLTELPDKKLLKRELRLSLEQAREFPGATP